MTTQTQVLSVTNQKPVDVTADAVPDDARQPHRMLEQGGQEPLQLGHLSYLVGQVARGRPGCTRDRMASAGMRWRVSVDGRAVWALLATDHSTRVSVWRRFRRSSEICWLVIAVADHTLLQTWINSQQGWNMYIILNNEHSQVTWNILDNLFNYYLLYNHCWALLHSTVYDIFYYICVNSLKLYAYLSWEVFSSFKWFL